MIKNLRKKFTLVAMGSMFLVLATIMVIFNLLNYIRFVREADRTLHMIAENDGRFPMPVAFRKMSLDPNRQTDMGCKGKSGIFPKMNGTECRQKRPIGQDIFLRRWMKQEVYYFWIYSILPLSQKKRRNNMHGRSFVTGIPQGFWIITVT